MTLQAKLDAFKADFEAGKPPYNVPPPVIAVMHRATAELKASGLAEKALKAGDKAPAFTLKDPEGNDVSSAALRALGQQSGRRDVVALRVLQGEGGSLVAGLQRLFGKAGGLEFGGGAAHDRNDRRGNIVRRLAGFEIGLESVQFGLKRHRRSP